MKNALYTLLLIATSLSAATAQTEKGRWTVGAQVGNISYRPSTGGLLSSRTATALFSPSAGYFVANNVAVGASVPVYYNYYRSQYSTFSSYTSTEIKNTQVGLSPFVRVYFGASKLRPFVSATAGFTQQWYSRVDLNNNRRYENSDNFFTYGGSAGVAYFINQNASLDASLGYSGGDQANVTDLVSNVSSQPGSFGLNVGFRLFFGR